MAVEELAKTLHPLERRAVPHLRKNGTLSELAAAAGMGETETMRALQWLEGKGCLTIATSEEERLVITEKGKKAAAEGLPEEHALRALREKGTLPISELGAALPTYDKGATGAVIGALKALKLPFITDDRGKPAFKWVDGLDVPAPAAKAVLAAAEKNGWAAENSGPGAKDLLKRQGYAELQKRRAKKYTLTKLGEQLSKAKGATKEYAERLTPAMLRGGAAPELRPYNVEVNVPMKARGRTHFVHDAIKRIKRIWLEMGFTEMAGRHAQTAFWDLDALFVPQDHPAREMQDTFYADVAPGSFDAQAYSRVKKAHEDGGDTGSTGWQTAFDKAESEKVLLRTHTTVLSAQTLWKIKHGKLPLPGKYFSVAKVYRNEALDWKHLFEFYQVEGIVVAHGMTLKHLKGYLRAFFTKMGYPDVRIRPAHFPYTEPSCEVEAYDAKKKQWVELGGAGIFRPEVTKTLIGEEVPVLAWGLGMERTIKEYYGLTDIRDLYRNDKKQLESMKAWY